MEQRDHQPTLRVLKVLEALADSSRGLGMTDISNAAGLAKSSVFPIVHTLCENGYIHYDKENSNYVLGIKTIELGKNFVEQFDFFSYVREEVRNIVKKCGETCHFGTLYGGDVLYLYKKDSPQPIRMFSAIGKKLPAYGTGIGKALLSKFSLEELLKLYPHGLLPLTENTITDINKLFEQLKTIRETGVAYEKEESNLMIQCVAVPVRRNGEVMFGMSVAIPLFRATDEKFEVAKEVLLAAAGRLEKILTTADYNFTEIFNQ